MWYDIWIHRPFKEKECPEKDSNAYGNLVYNKDGFLNLWRKDGLFKEIMLGHLCGQLELKLGLNLTTYGYILNESKI